MTKWQRLVMEGEFIAAIRCLREQGMSLTAANQKCRNYRDERAAEDKAKGEGK